MKLYLTLVSSSSYLAHVAVHHEVELAGAGAGVRGGVARVDEVGGEAARGSTAAVHAVPVVGAGHGGREVGRGRGQRGHRLRRGEALARPLHRRQRGLGSLEQGDYIYYKYLNPLYLSIVIVSMIGYPPCCSRGRSAAGAARW